MTALAPEPTERHVTFEILGMCPKLRDDLRVSVQAYAGKTCYVIEDVLSSKFFRLGIAEYTFVSLLDGKTTIAEAMGQTAEICGQDALTDQESVALCRWLLESSLASTDQSNSEARLSESRSKRLTRQHLGSFNPLIQKLRLFNPMPLLRVFDRFADRCFSLPGFIVWASVVGSGVVAMWGSWDALSANSLQVFSPSNWCWLLATWFVLKLIHESGHALACRRFGVHVRESGVVLILFAPMPYVDVTDAWKIDSKWKRILISAAGMYAEVLCAAIAAVVWSSTFDPLLRQHAMNVIVTASVMTLVFNANPLMRFDGYYILTDWLEMPNLSTNARRWFSYALRRYVMGMQVRCPNWSEGRHGLVVAYAFAAMLWRVFVCVSLAISAEILFYGAGKAIAVTAIALWICIPTYRSIRTFAETRTANRRRVLYIGFTVAMSLWFLWSAVPWHTRSTVPVIVDYHPPKEIRTCVDGFVDQSYVSQGDQVSQGQLLATLSNPELRLEHQLLKLDLQKSQVRHREFLTGNSIAAASVEEKMQAAIGKRLLQIEEQLAGLAVRASVDGVISSSDLESRTGTFLERGDRMFTIGTREDEQIVGLVDQADADAFRRSEGDSLDVRIWGMGSTTVTGRIRRVLPRASQSLPYAALGATAGGPLAVRQNPDAENRDDARELIEARVPVLIEIAGFDSEGLMPGQTGYAQLTYRDRTLGRAIWYSLGRWIEHKRAALRNQG